MKFKYALVILLCWLSTPALAQKTKAALTAEINAVWPDNTSGIITPAKLRAVVIDIVNSYYDLNGSNSLVCAANQWVIGFPSLSSLSCAQPTISSISGLGTGVATFLSVPSSANLAAAVTDETGTGALVFGTSPTISTGFTLGYITGSTQCLHVNTSGAVTGTGSDCGAGGGGSPGGTNGQVQYNNAGAFGGFTTSGDATINTSTGALTLSTVNANVGAFGSATSCVTTTANAKGLITAISAATCTPAIGSITGLGTGIATALAVNVGSAGAPVLFNGAGGTPTSLVGTNITGTASGLTAGTASAVAVGGITGAGTGCITWLTTPSSANLRGCLTDESGTGVAYFQGGDLGTPSAGVGTNLTSLNATNLASGTVAATRGGAGTINGVLSGNGAGVVSQGATTGLTDATTDTVWTPIDASGAGLTFTVASARYAKVGKLTIINLRLTFPSTASGAAATIGGLPVVVSTNYNATNNHIGSCFTTFAGSQQVIALAPANTTAFTLINSAGATITNANMSTLLLLCTLTYVTT